MSTTYQVKSLTTLKTDTVSLDKLSRNLKLNSIVSCDDRPLGLVAHWDLVFFARTWAGWALEVCGEKTPPSALEALSLVDKWLQDPGSVSSEELRAAAAAAAEAAAWAAARAAEAAAWAAARAAARAAEAAEAAWAAEAVGADAEAARAAAAAGAAAEAAWAAEAVGAAWAAEAVGAEAAGAATAAGAAAYQRQGEFIIEHLKNSSPSSFPFPST